MVQPRDICRKCASTQKTCCQEVNIVLTDKDVSRIAEHLQRSDFHEYRRLSADYFWEDSHSDAKKDVYWIKLLVKRDGTSHVLKIRDNGDCIFLKQDGCVLPLDVRPLICRIYPHYFNTFGLVRIEAYCCPQEVFPQNDPRWADCLDAPKDKACAWHKQLYAELRDGSIFMENSLLADALSGNWWEEFWPEWR